VEVGGEEEWGAVGVEKKSENLVPKPALNRLCL